MKKTLVSLVLCLTVLLPLSARAAQTAPPIPDRGTPPGAAASCAPPADTEILPIPTPAPTVAAPGEPISPDLPAPTDVPPVSSGQPGRGHTEALEAYFEENGYPDHISYVFKAGGELRGEQVYEYWQIGLVNGTEEQKQAILDLAAPTCLISFENALFSHEEKVRAYEAIAALEDPNITHLYFGKNTDTVWVGVEESLCKQYAEYLIGDLELGAVVSVTDTNSFAYILSVVPTLGLGEIGTTGAIPPSPVPLPVPAPGPVPDSAVSPFSLPLFPLLLIGLVLLALFFTARAFRPVPFLAGNASPVPRRDVEQTILDAAPAPSEEVYTKILKQLDEE